LAVPSFRWVVKAVRVPAVPPRLARATAGRNFFSEILLRARPGVDLHTTYYHRPTTFNTMGRSKLRAALAAEKGVDFKKLKEKKRSKEKQKTKQATGKASKGGVSSDPEEDEDDWEDEDGDEDSEEEDGEDDDSSSRLIDDMAEESDEDGESEDEDESAGVSFLSRSPCRTRKQLTCD